MSLDLNKPEQLSNFLAVYNKVFSVDAEAIALLRKIAETEPAFFMAAAGFKSEPKYGATYEKTKAHGFIELSVYGFNGSRPYLTFASFQRIFMTAYEGRKVESIKDLRNATGIGLKEAKDLVEAWTAESDRATTSYR